MNRAYSSTVTGNRPMKNSPTKTRWTGRSSSSPSPAPIRNSPAGMRARSGVVGSDKGRSIVQGHTLPWCRETSTLSTMRLERFDMERMQSTYENQVAFNLSESGVHPLRLKELVDDADSTLALLDEPLRYTQSNGTARLRSAVAGLYPGATPEHVQVTNGGSEANCITTWRLVERDDEVVLMVPNYMQTWGLARAFGGVIKEWPLAFDGRWRLDAGALERIVSPRTKLIIICNPNNPTGARFEAADLDRVAAVAAGCGAWILSDEIYRGAERDGRETPSMWDGRTASSSRAGCRRRT